MTTVFLVTGFSMLFSAGVMVYNYRTTVEDASSLDTFGLSSIPFHISTLLLVAFVFTLFGSVGIASNLVPIKAQAGDRIHEPLTYRPGFVSFNHRIVPESS